MPELKLQFAVWCSCGNGLCHNTTEGHNRYSQYITVKPCEKCLKDAYVKGYTDSRKETTMKCAECAQRPILQQTGWHQEINQRAEWKCPGCGQEYYYQDDRSLSTQLPMFRNKTITHEP